MHRPSRFPLPLRRTILGVVFSLCVAAPFAAAEELVGQIACSSCWLEADRQLVPYGTAEDLACAARCASEGIPPSLAVARGGAFVLVELEGDAPDGRPWLEHIGSFARVSGTLSESAEGPKLRATAWEPLDESPWPAPAAPEPAELTWTDLRGRRVGLDGYRGRLVVLNFWATWCAPCKKEMPDLAAIQRDYGVFGVQVLGATADAADQSEGVLEFARRSRVNFPVLLGATSEQMQSLGLGVTLPATVVLDEDGHVMQRFRGIVSRRELASVLDDALAGGAAHAHGDEHGPAVASAATGHRHGSQTQASLVPS